MDLTFIYKYKMHSLYYVWFDVYVRTAAYAGHCQGEADSVTIPQEGVFIKTLRAAKDELSKNHIGQPDQIQLPFGRVAGSSRPDVRPKFLARMGVPAVATP